MTDLSFGKLNQELEEIIVDLQSEDKDINEVIRKYQRGIDLIDKLEKHLSEAENKINKLKPNIKKNKLY